MTRCNCESAYCVQHGGDLARCRCDACPNAADETLWMGFVGPCCKACAAVNPSIVSEVRRIGFTGTREGMTLAQAAALESILRATDRIILHHGDCYGADTQAAWIARKIDWVRIVLHPPTKNDARAYSALPGDEEREAKPYLERNHDIVDETDLLVAAPRQAEEQLRSGTWATIRYARKTGKAVWIILPDGAIDKEDV